MAVPVWISNVVRHEKINDSVILMLLGGSVMIAFTLCCILKCIRYRIPRTKQEIQLRLHKRTLTKTFKRYLDMLTVSTETSFDEAICRVRVLREADLAGFEKKSSLKRSSPCEEKAGRAFKDQCTALSMPEICHTGPNNIALLPLDISVVKEILRHQHSDLSNGIERDFRREREDSRDNGRSDTEDNEVN